MQGCSSRMNILILIRRFDFGGSENHVRELANELAEQGQSVFVVGKSGRQRKLLGPRVKFYSALLSKWILPINLFYLIVLAKRHRIDVIHAHQPSAILAGSILGRLLGIPVIATVHTTTGAELRTEFVRKTPSRIIYVSRHSMERSDWYSSLQPKCRYIPNGIVPHQYLSKGGAPRLVYCSRLDKNHGSLLNLLVEEVLPILKVAFPQLVIEVVGDGCMHASVETWAKKTNEVLGDGTMVVSGFKEFFSANSNDGFVVVGVGRVALEALSFGIPVLAINNKRHGPLVSTANYSVLSKTNFVDVTAPKPTKLMLVDAITDVLRNYRDVVADSHKLWERVNVDFSIHTLAEQIQVEYRGAIEANRLPKDSADSTSIH